MANDSDLTLRVTADAIDDRTEWSAELEANRLTEKVTGADGIQNGVVAKPENVFASGNESAYKPVYPEIPGFGSLDISALDSGARNTLDGFCTAITKGVDADSFMANGQLYSLVLFLYDLNQNDNAAFGSYIIGEPFDADGVLECPVRFFYVNKKSDSKEKAKPFNAFDPSLDVYVYLIKNENVWKIEQITYDVEQ